MWTFVHMVFHNYQNPSIQWCNLVNMWFTYTWRFPCRRSMKCYQNCLQHILPLLYTGWSMYTCRFWVDTFSVSILLNGWISLHGVLEAVHGGGNSVSVMLKGSRDCGNSDSTSPSIISRSGLEVFCSATD